MTILANQIVNGIRIFDRYTGYVDFIVKGFIIFFMAAVFILVFSQVIVRFTPLRVVWLDEGATFAAAYLGIWGSSTCLRIGYHLQVKLVWDYLPVAFGRLVSMTVYFILFGFCIVLVKYGHDMAVLGRGQLSQSGTFSVYLARLAIPTGGFLIGLQAINLVAREIAGYLGATDWVEEDDEEPVPQEDL